MIGQQIVRISWGRSPTAKQVIAFTSLINVHFDPAIGILSMLTFSIMLYFTYQKQNKRRYNALFQKPGTPEWTNQA